MRASSTLRLSMAGQLESRRTDPPDRGGKPTSSPSTGRDGADRPFFVSPPPIGVPKGGGAIKAIGEKFAANPVTGTGSMSVPIATSAGRGGFGPRLALTYDSGSGNGLFGLGWNLALPSISRKTDKGLPQYRDEMESDVFLLAGAEDLVPVLDAAGQLPPFIQARAYSTDYLVRTYRPRVEGLFALIERWVERDNPANMFWRTITRDNVTTWYGRTTESRVMDPQDGTRIFEWWACETHDDRGNVAVHHYVREDAANVATHSVDEVNRTSAQRCAKVLPDRILYGNRKAWYPTLAVEGATWPEPDGVAGQEWMFEAVFDYSDPADAGTPDAAPTDTARWRVRADPFSTHFAGFEIRCYRLCRRVLMFHRFAELGSEPCLVRCTDFEYLEPRDLADPQQPGYTVLKSVTQRSYQKRRAADVDYESRQLPPISFLYSTPAINAEVKSIPRTALANLPTGTQGAGYQWIDLDGEGLAGVLSEQAGAWYYKPNLGNATFGDMRLVARKPAMAALAAGRQQLLDIDGGGEVELVDLSGPTPGFHQRARDDGWKRFVPFASLPNIDWSDANLRFVDLTGDGLADALVTEDDVFTWYPSLAQEGFGAAARNAKVLDEMDGPRIVFNDGTQTIFLADMCGDGLSDLVRVRNDEVCYWPNLGYGRFGRKITLGNSPHFDRPDCFDARRIRMADIDGSGPSDIIYLNGDGTRLYFNRSGNSLSDAASVPLPLATENLAAVQVADLFGNGTACLVWNSHLPADADSPTRYVDLMGGDEPPGAQRRHGKPHLLIEVDNHLGGTTEIEYSPSTQFYLQDRAAGTPWISQLPFPVHCVSRITVRDKWRGTAFSSTLSYHHGYFDGVEREFRGFGRVEQLDVEDFGRAASNNAASPFVTQDQTLYQPPIKTITWYHTGAALDRERILNQFANEYFPQRFADRLPDPSAPNSFREKPLLEPELPADLSSEEWREALRACKGMVLRQEIYELDIEDLTATAPKHTPVRIHSAATHNCHIEVLQRRGASAHAIFLVTESEALAYQYELAIPKDGAALEPDPRIQHTLRLRTDALGNSQQAIAVGYPRWRPGDFTGLPRADLIVKVQSELHVAYTESRYTADVVIAADPNDPRSAIKHRRLRMPCETKAYEITGIELPASGYLDIDTLRRHQLCEDALYPPPVPATERIAVANLLYHQQQQAAGAHRRIVQRMRTRYFKDEDSIARPVAAHDFGEHGPRGLKYEDYQLALTEELLEAVFTRTVDATTERRLSWPLWPAAAGAPQITARDELDAPAPQGLPYLASGYIRGTGIDPTLAGQYWIRSGIAGFMADARAHFYLPTDYTDAFGNVTTLRYDTRDLFLESSVDARGNTGSVERFDYRVLAPAEIVDVNGNHNEVAFDILGLVIAAAIKGRQLAGTWQGDDLSTLDFDIANPSVSQVAAFCTATNPNRVRAAQWLGNATTRFVYHFGDVGGQWARRPAGSCAITRERHVGQLSAGESSELQISLECTDGSGSVLMKKAQAEAALPGGALRWVVNGLTLLNNKGNPVRQYEPSFVDDFGCQLPPAYGVSPTLFYDAAGRLVRTEHPDGTLSRVEFSPWHTRTFDQNDTVLESAWYARNSDPAASVEDRRAAELAARHADTPALEFLDSLGRGVVTMAHNRAPDATDVWRDELHCTFTRLDAEGKALWIRDARGNLVMQYIAPPKPTRLIDTPANPNDPTDTTLEYRPPGSAPCYDMAGNLLHQHSMDGGDRWTLLDAAGKPMLTWDYNERTRDDGSMLAERRLFYTSYDELHRPLEQWLRINDDPPALIEALEYLDVNSFRDAAGVFNQPALNAAQELNLLGTATKHYDPRGLATVERIDFKGATEEVTRTLVRDVTPAVIDWDVPERASLLETDTFRQIVEHDALGRMTRLFNWHRDTVPDRVAVYVPRYNARGLLESEKLHIRATKTRIDGKLDFVPHAAPARNVDAIQEVRWNAKGQKVSLTLGNGTTTRYTYDDRSFRLLHLYTRRDARFPADCDGDPDALRPARACGVQNLHFTYDAVGNITRRQDDAQDTIWFANAQIDASSDFTYDALYRLISATGRENTAAQAPPLHPEGDWPVGAMPAPDSVNRYLQRYAYDETGNFLRMSHRALRGPGQGNGDWIRQYQPASDSNRLLRTWFGDRDWDDTPTDRRTSYRYDSHGSMLNLANTAPATDIRWDWRDMIRALDLQGGGAAYYSYGIDKQRTRKRLVRNPTALNGGTLREDRIYLGGYELYRRYTGDPNDPIEEIESHHLFEGEQRVLLVDDVIRTRNPRPDRLTVREQTLFRYQYSDQLGSACLELDDAADIISYEEYHPFGTSAYRMMNSSKEAPPKRYRYTGTERDEESGLSYQQARYYASGLARWLSTDPRLLDDGPNLYAYVSGNPVGRNDRSGTQGEAQTNPDKFAALPPYLQKQILAGQARDDVSSTFATAQPQKTFKNVNSPDANEEDVTAEIVMGDFYEGPSTAEGMAGNVAVGVVPIVGQVADARDILAGIFNVFANPKSPGSWLLLGVAAIALVPGEGDAVKAAFKTFLKERGIKYGSKELDNAIKQFLKHDWDSGPLVLAFGQTKVAVMEVINKLKPNKAPMNYDLLAEEVKLLQGALNELLSANGMRGFKGIVEDALTNKELVKETSEQVRKSLEPAATGFAHRHLPDGIISGNALGISGEVEKRVNSVLGPNSARLAREILELPNDVEHFFLNLVLKVK